MRDTKMYPLVLGDLVTASYGGVKITGILTADGIITHPGEGWFICRGSIVPEMIPGARCEQTLYVRTYKLHTACPVTLAEDDVVGYMFEQSLTPLALEGAKEVWSK